MRLPLTARGLAALAAAALAAAPLVPAAAHAQIRASELASVSQVIDGTRLTVEYSRPRVRGRDAIYGTVEKWGHTWTPGANWATTLHVSRPVTLDGHALPAGKYSVWFVLRESGEWTLTLDSAARLFHMDPPDTTRAVLRIPVRATEGPFTEVLTWSFPAVRVNGATLAFNWERKQVVVDVAVEPSLAVTMPEAEAKPYLGRWALTPLFGRDSGKVGAFEIYYEAGTLKGNFEPKDGYLRDFAMIRVGPGMFTVGLYEKGELYEVLRPDLMFRFTMDGGTPTAFEMRGEQDELFATARRPAGRAAAGRE